MSGKGDSVKASIVKKTANICRKSIRTVQRVVEGTQVNEVVLNTYKTLLDADNKVTAVVDEMSKQLQVLNEQK